MTHAEIRNQLLSEIRRANARYGPFRSTHEGLGVLTEEYAELVSAVRSNMLESVRMEAIQVAAVALRIAFGIDDPDMRQRSIK